MLYFKIFIKLIKMGFSLPKEKQGKTLSIIHINRINIFVEGEKYIWF